MLAVHEASKKIAQVQLRFHDPSDFSLRLYVSWRKSVDGTVLPAGKNFFGGEGAAKISSVRAHLRAYHRPRHCLIRSFAHSQVRPSASSLANI